MLPKGNEDLLETEQGGGQEMRDIELSNQEQAASEGSQKDVNNRSKKPDYDDDSNPEENGFDAPKDDDKNLGKEKKSGDKGILLMENHLLARQNTHLKEEVEYLKEIIEHMENLLHGYQSASPNRSTWV